MDIQVYADKARIEPDDSKSVLVYMNGVDLSDVLGQYNVQDILDMLDFSDVASYVSKISAGGTDDERSY